MRKFRENKIFKEINFGNNDNPSKIKKEHFSKEQIEEMAKEYNSNKILGFKVPIILEKYFEQGSGKSLLILNLL